MERDKDRYKALTRRTVLMGGAQVGLLGVLAARLYYLQVLQADTYATMAEDNRINVRLIAPQRGRIVDRFGVPLATNNQNYRVTLVAEQAGDVGKTLDAIGALIPVTDDDKRKVERDMKRRHPFVPVVVRENLTWEEVARIEINLVELPGVSVEVGSARAYPFAERASHVIGYVAPVSEDELNDDPLLELPDFRIGKAGIERSQDALLRGAAGTDEIEVNALGRVVRDIVREQGDPGEECTLALDMALQDFAMKRLADEKAASAIIMDATNGEVLVMASTPSYDANDFTRGLPATLWHSLISNPLGPLNNKAIQGVYPPGSTFKPCTALAGLDSGAITPDFTVTCTGSMKLGNAEFHCWVKHGHGTLDLHGGLKHSCDIYFYEVARRVGVDGIAAMAKRLGFSDPTGVDIPNERQGLIPTKAWKKKTYGVPWQNGETLSVGIGQGYVSATPLQLCTMLSRLVTNKEIVPHLVRQEGIMSNNPAAVTPPDPDAEPPAVFDGMNFDPAHLQAVLSGMNAVVNEQGGTAYAARIMDHGMEMGGKSGTAQVRHISKEERDRGIRKGEDLPWIQREHALFIAFAPVGDPRYVAAVVVEHGIGGSKYAAPIARDLLVACQQRDPARTVPADPTLPIGSAQPMAVASTAIPGTPGAKAANAPNPNATADAAIRAGAASGTPADGSGSDDSDGREE